MRHYRVEGRSWQRGILASFPSFRDGLFRLVRCKQLIKLGLDQSDQYQVLSIRITLAVREHVLPESLDLWCAAEGQGFSGSHQHFHGGVAEGACFTVIVQ